jgi:hypothetical protein
MAGRHQPDRVIALLERPRSAAAVSSTVVVVWSTVSCTAETGSATVQLRSVTRQAIAGTDIRTTAETTIRLVIPSRIANHPRTVGHPLREI